MLLLLHFDNPVCLMMQHRVCALTVKLDIVHTFKYILVHPKGWPFIGSIWEAVQHSGTIYKKYYTVSFFPFDLFSSLVLLSEHDDTLEYAICITNIPTYYTPWVTTFQDRPQIGISSRAM